MYLLSVCIWRIKYYYYYYYYYYYFLTCSSNVDLSLFCCLFDGYFA